MLTLLAGLPIMYFPYANLTMGQLTIRMATTAGSGSLIIGVLLVVLGLTMWFQPMVRVFSGVAAILLALVSLVVSNFGGFVIGFLLGLIGGALAISWAPGAVNGDARGDRAKNPDKAPDEDEVDVSDAPGTGNGATLPMSDPLPVSAGADDEQTNGRHRAG